MGTGPAAAAIHSTIAWAGLDTSDASKWGKRGFAHDPCIAVGFFCSCRRGRRIDSTSRTDSGNRRTLVSAVAFPSTCAHARPYKPAYSHHASKQHWPPDQLSHARSGTRLPLFIPLTCARRSPSTSRHPIPLALLLTHARSAPQRSVRRLPRSVWLASHPKAFTARTLIPTHGTIRVPTTARRLSRAPAQLAPVASLAIPPRIAAGWYGTQSSRTQP
ncbi:hypothetical protein BCR44DRAFT_1433980 [Catenaria anguillulae PL171]|uniref:Uncharacterized protein n=1 Tax=Catenaria anguillulae PL171 TaxID=765915 RepID=A0A1Y2HPF4_9FUNG|nr:hypothetical protein BCR44DRAFT_1433980 [Catenaria anguillulae PL171]